MQRTFYSLPCTSLHNLKKGNVSTNCSRINEKTSSIFSCNFRSKNCFIRNVEASSAKRLIWNWLITSNKNNILGIYQQWAQEGSRVNTDPQILLNQHKPSAFQNKHIIKNSFFRQTYLTFPVVKLRGRYRKESIRLNIFVVLAYILFSYNSNTIICESACMISFWNIWMHR